MFREKTTEEILKLINEAQYELLLRQKDYDTYYKVFIAKYVKEKMEEALSFDVKNLDALVENIEKYIEVMRPVVLNNEKK